MRVLETFIPIDRRLALARGEPLPDRTIGTALFADISGFTPLTDALTRLHGAQRGAEELTRHLDRVYDALIAELDRYGGSVIGFSGDAITCWFDETMIGAERESEPSQTFASALRAIACALGMQDALRQYAKIVIAPEEAVSITVKIAIAEGPVRRFRVGDPAIRYLDTIAGATLDRLAATEQSAHKAEIVLQADTASRLGDKLAVSEWREVGAQRYAIVERLNLTVPPRPWSGLPGDALTDEQVKPWVLPYIYERVRSGRGEFLAELRPVVSLFNRFSGINYDADDAAGDKLNAFLQWAQRVLARYEGTLIELTIGDKGSYLHAALGAPMAHDDDALRAVAVAQELRALPSDLNFISRVQMGISRGYARVGPYGAPARRTYGAIGDDTNVAARLMQQAAPGQIIVSRRVAQATDHRYQFRALGAVQVKGKAEPVDIFGLVGLRSGLPLVGGVSTPERRRAPIVGRAAELAVLHECVERLLGERRGGTVILQGEAGIGKSRLVEELLEVGRAAGATCILAAGDAVEQAAIYFPWRAVFAQVFELDTLPNDPAIWRDQVLAWLKANSDEPELVQFAPLLNAVLPLNLPENQPIASLTGRARAEATRDLLARILRRTIRAVPLVIVIEDAHWLDSASWALLERVALLDVPLLLVIATRPLAAPPPEFERIRSSPNSRELILEPLPAADVSNLIQQRLGVHSLSQPVLDLICERAEGNPFFSEELAYALRDAGVIRLHGDAYELAPNALELRSLQFPDTVEGVVTSRIDRLTASQQLAIKVASVIGRIFAFRVLCEIHPVRDDTNRLEDDLDVLARLDLTPVEATEPELTYIFKHVITQQVAYNLMLFAQRQALHRAVGEWYERTFSQELAPYYALLSYHWSNAVKEDSADPSVVLKAIDYLRKAGKQAVQGNANTEAVGFLTHALELVNRLPQSAERLKLELGVLIDLAPALIATRGYGDATVERNFARARALCEQLGLVPQLFPVLNGLNFYYMVRVNLPAAFELTERQYAIAQQLQDPTLLRATANALIAPAFFSGQVSKAVTYLDLVASPFPLEQERAMATLFGHNPTQATLVIGGVALWVLGYPDQARARSQAGLALAHQIAHAHSEAYASLFVANLFCFLRDVTTTRKLAEETVAISRKYGFPVWAANGTAVHGWTLACEGQTEAGIAEIQQGIALYQQFQIDLAVPHFLGLLADAYLSAGKVEEGLGAVERGLEQARRTGELWIEAELCRMRGELLLAQAEGNPEPALAVFQEAIEIAQRQQAKAWELRATLSECRLLKRHGNPKQAREELIQLYNWFTEGLETPDLQDARVLIAELE